MLIPDLDICRRFLEHRPPPGRVVQCAVTGAHIYGFPSEDSDLDIKGMHLAPTRDLLGLHAPTEAHDALEIFEDVECDLTTHEARTALSLLLRGNGNMLERFTSPLQLVNGSEELRQLAEQSVSLQSYRHYSGYLKGMRREHASKRRAKTALYAYRVALTGMHLLKTGTIEPNVNTLAPLYGRDVTELVAFKREHGEKCALPAALDEHHRAAFDGLAKDLAEARASSKLPEQAPNAADIEDWLVRARLGQL
ncbi:MAG: nucleotidyltransferase domain-containing protein [Proteobacteria bacterium]|nr:nucleotidyltransferase domain-containing protein [Pseudomonadota bacterium]